MRGSVCVGVSTPHRRAMYVRANQSRVSGSYGLERREGLGEGCCEFGLLMSTSGFTSG